MPLLLVPPLACQAPATGVDRARLWRDLETLAAPGMEGRAPGTGGHRRARAYLLERLRASGLAPLGAGFAHPFTYRGGPKGTNLLATLPGTAPGAGVIVLSAHYDHLGIRGGVVYPGADDNASGVAALLALAAHFKAHPPAHTLVFALFDAEEGGLHGSRAFVSTMPFKRDQVRLDVNLDMVGRNDKGELYVAGTTRSPLFRPLLDSIARRASVTLRMGHDTGPGRDDWTHESDHGSFHDAGIPWLYFGVEDHPDYHTPLDTAARIDPDFFARATETILEAVIAIDGMK